jgi:hypothetical protein
MNGYIDLLVLLLVLDGGDWSSSRSSRFILRGRATLKPDTRLGGLESRSGLWGKDKNVLTLSGIEHQFLSQSARSLAQYQLS